jgi:hypothetical protein
MEVTADTIAFIVLGVLSFGFGLWSRGRSDQLLDDDALDDDEHEYQSDILGRGSITLMVAGIILLGTGVTLLFVRH